MVNEPELIANTVVDPRKWDEALSLLAECESIADFSHDCDDDPYCEVCETLTRARAFLKENE